MSRKPKQEKENTLLSHLDNNKCKESSFIHRRSSSTSDLETLQANHYQTDMEHLNISNTLASTHSENALEQLEKTRHVSPSDDMLIDHLQQDEMEQVLESHARQKNVQLVFDAEIVERTQDELKRQMSRNAFASSSSESEESMIDSKLLLHKNIRNRSSSRHSSISGKKKCKMVGSDMSDVSFEAHLEAKARQESLANTEIEQKVFQICATNIEKTPLGSEMVMITDDDSNLNNTSGSVTVLLQTVADQISEEQLEKVARQNSLLGCDSPAYDDNYLSSSSCMTPLYSPSSPNPNKSISNSTFSMSVNRTDEDSCKCMVPNEKLTMALGMSQERMDESETTSCKKNLDECSGAVTICIDTVGKTSEELLNKVARRHFEHNYLSSNSVISATPDDSQSSSNTDSRLDKGNFDMPRDHYHHTKGDKDEDLKTSALGMSLDSSDENDTKINDSTCTSTDCVNSDEDISLSEVPLTRRKSSVMDDLSILCSDCNMIKQKCNECQKLMKSQESLRRNERRLSLHSELVENSMTSEKKSTAEKAGVLNGIRDINAESTCGGWISPNEGTSGVERKSNAIGDRSRGSNFMEWFSSNEDMSGMASPKILCNTDHEHINGDCNAGMKMNKKTEIRNQADKERLTESNGDDEKRNHENEQIKVFPSENSDRIHFTRQEKVGYWLHSLTKTNTRTEVECPDTCTGKGQTLIHDADLNEKNNRLDTRNDSRSLCESNSYQGSPKGSVAEEDVFYSADESVKPNNSKNGAERPDSLKLKELPVLSKKNNMMGSNRSKTVNGIGRTGSVDSDGSSGTTQKSSAEVRMNMHDSGTLLWSIIRIIVVNSIIGYMERLVLIGKLY